jgi:hypothetical protein
MRLHLVPKAPRPKEAQRPAKVVQLETRRQARLERHRPDRHPPRPAA